MSRQELEEMFTPVLEDVAQRSMVAERFIDKNLYQIYIATLWANVVLDPAEVGIGEEDLEDLHEVLNSKIATVLGAEQNITACFRFINSRSGETAMNEARRTKTHRELLLYFSSLILDPTGHKRWMDQVKRDSR